MNSAYDYLIVGAGFAGSVLAERLARGSGKSVLLCDRRNHIGGNAYDCLDQAGLLIHKYGPHIFHTNSKVIFDYLSQFTAWRKYEHRVLASVDGKLLPIPVNLDTINKFYGLALTEDEAGDFLASIAEVRDPIRTSEDAVIGRVGRKPYDEFFDLRFGKLPYRSLQFKHETREVEWFQPTAVVNYPNDFSHTRITEFKYLTGQRHRRTSIVYEYPRSTGDAYYPIPRPENAAIYAKYRNLAQAMPNVHFVGRLATYRYYNMDQVIGQALTLYRKFVRASKGQNSNGNGSDSALGRGRMHGQPGRRSTLQSART